MTDPNHRTRRRARGEEVRLPAHTTSSLRSTSSATMTTRRRTEDVPRDADHAQRRAGQRATCVSVPVTRAHSEAIWVETEKPLSLDDVREAFRKAPGVVLQDDPSDQVYLCHSSSQRRTPSTWVVCAKDLATPNGLTFWCVPVTRSRRAQL